MSAAKPRRADPLAPAPSAPGGPAILVTGLHKLHGQGATKVHSIDGLDVSVPEGQFLCVMGPSGSGKSTLLHLLAGLDRPTSGSIRVGDTEVHTLSQDAAARFRRRHVGLVFQFFNLIPSLSVEENVALGLLLEGHRLSRVRGRIEPLLARLGITERRSHAPAQLSGGEMQRVAIARALAMEPMLLLADEPTGNLDQKAGEEVLSLLKRSCEERGVTTILVTHDLQAASYAERVLLLRDGRIEDDVPASSLGSSL